MTEDRIVSIIDDDISVRVALESLVRSLGYAARTFDCAESFLQSGSFADASCIVTDVQMTGMNGLDLQCRLRAAGCTVPTIFVTAFPDDHVRARAKAGGAFGFLTKPFDGPELVGLLISAIERSDVPTGTPI